MGAFRTLAAAGLAVSLLAIPALSVAQSEADPEASAAPLAREPDGRLPIERTPWRLEAYQDGEREGVPGPEVAAFIELGSSFFDGSGGCSRIQGRYGVAGPAIAFNVRRKDRICAENLAVVQQAVERGLRQAAAYEVQAGASAADDKLIIYSVTGLEVLRYGLDDLAQLDGTEWRLASYTRDGEAVPASEAMPGRLTFRPDSEAVYKRRQSGPLSGTTGCNGLVSEFFRRSSVISFSQLELTDAPCTSELAAQEVAMTAVLEATAVRLEVPADGLILTSVDTDERREFVIRNPLEGTTWWLERTGFGATEEERYTLRLEDGVAAGEGPCGPFSARYVTDGAFITFTDARGARDEACSELRTERALISGLRRSVRITRGPERLAFQDARGIDTLAFGLPFAP